MQYTVQYTYSAVYSTVQYIVHIVHLTCYPLSDVTLMVYFVLALLVVCLSSLAVV